MDEPQGFQVLHARSDLCSHVDQTSKTITIKEEEEKMMDACSARDIPHGSYIPDGFDARLEVIRRSKPILTQVDG